MSRIVKTELYEPATIVDKLWSILSKLSLVCCAMPSERLDNDSASDVNESKNESTDWSSFMPRS